MSEQIDLDALEAFYQARVDGQTVYAANTPVLTLIAIARAAQAVAAYDGSSANVFHDLMAQLRDALAAIKEAGK